MALLAKIGYGQVEPNHLSAQRTGQIYAQSPAVAAITALENGMFLKVDPKTNESTAATTATGEWMLVFNEVKLYNNAFEGYKDFRLTKEQAAGGVLIPRLFKTNIGDRFTTNLIDGTPALGAKLVPTKSGDVGILTVKAEPAAGEMVFEIIKIYTMPDGQAGVKVVRTV